MKLFLLICFILLLPFKLDARGQATNRSQASNRANTFSVNAVDFNSGGTAATNPYFERGAALTGAVDSRVGIFSLWIKVSTNIPANTTPLILASTDGERFGRIVTISETFSLDIRACDNNVGYVANGAPVAGTNNIPADGEWHHVLISWDLANNVHHFYIDDTETENLTFFVNQLICWTSADWAIGNSVGGGLNTFAACIAEMYAHSTAFLDFSIVANRRLFITANLEAVNLGNTGSRPTNTNPIIYMNGGRDTFLTNTGTGGDFVLQQSQLIDCSTTPPVESRTSATNRAQESC